MSTSQHRIFKGTPYIAPYATPLKLVSLGNTAKITYSAEIEEKSVPDYENGGGGNAEALFRIKAAKLTLELKKISAANLAIALGGSATPIAGGAVVDEAHVAYKGCFIPLDKPQDLTKSLTVKVGVIAKVEGTDYIRKNGGIVIIADGTIVDEDALKISYTALAGFTVEGLVDITREYRVRVDGFDEVSGDSSQPDFYRMRLQPAKSIEYIGDDFVSLTIEATLLADATKNGIGISKYTNLKIGG